METEVAPQNQDLLMIVQNLNKNLTVSHIVSKVMVKSHLNKTLIQPSPKHLRATDFLMIKFGT